MSFIDRIYNLGGDAEEAKTLYDKWAKDYDHDVNDASQDYVGPATTVAYVLDFLGTKQIAADLPILDAGCGTGLVGVGLAAAGARQVDGVDLSPGMLDYARKTGAYRDLEPADLTQPLRYGDNTYGGVTCVGTLTQGHVGPEPLADFARVVKPGGFIVCTILDSIWVPGGYEAQVKALEAEGRVKLLKAQVEDYRRGAGLRAMMISLKVLK